MIKVRDPELGISDGVKKETDEIIAKRLFLLGMFFIIISVSIPDGYFQGWIFHLNSSLFENIGAALIIPYLFLSISKVILGPLKTIKRRPKLIRLIESMESEIKILGINLHGAHDHSGKNNQKAVKETMDLMANREPNDKSKHFIYKILLLDPESPFFESREIEENQGKRGRLLGEMKETIENLEKVIDKIQKNNKNIELHCRFYNAMPKQGIICVDGKKVYMGPYFFRIEGFESPWISIEDNNNNNEYFKVCRNEFNYLWDDDNTKSILRIIKNKDGKIEIDTNKTFLKALRAVKLNEDKWYEKWVKSKTYFSWSKKYTRSKQGCIKARKE